MNAIYIKADGTQQEVTPKNGKTFQLEELQKYVGGYIEIITLKDGRKMVVNEEGKLNNLPINNEASKLYGRGLQLIVGDVVVTDAELID